MESLSKQETIEFVTKLINISSLIDHEPYGFEPIEFNQWLGFTKEDEKNGFESDRTYSEDEIYEYCLNYIESHQDEIDKRYQDYKNQKGIFKTIVELIPIQIERCYKAFNVDKNKDIILYATYPTNDIYNLTIVSRVGDEIKDVAFKKPFKEKIDYILKGKYIHRLQNDMQSLVEKLESDWRHYSYISTNNDDVHERDKANIKEETIETILSYILGIGPTAILGLLIDRDNGDIDINEPFTHYEH